MFCDASQLPKCLALPSLRRRRFGFEGPFGVQGLSGWGTPPKIESPPAEAEPCCIPLNPKPSTAGGSSSWVLRKMGVLWQSGNHEGEGSLKVLHGPAAFNPKTPEHSEPVGFMKTHRGELKVRSGSLTPAAASTRLLAAELRLPS